MRRGRTETPAVAWRLLVDGKSDGAANMATDEALLDAYLRPGGSTRAPTLRLYGWDPPALSLGKGQPVETAHDAAFLIREGIDLVRRPTGGQTVLHEHERTYCVVGRLDRPPFDRGLLDSYASISAALQSAFALLGVRTETAGRAVSASRDPVCFNVSSAHELLHAGRKVAGSAQLRRRRAFLQHGSIPYHVDPRRLGDAIGIPVDGERFTGLRQLLDRIPRDEEIDAALIEGFSQAFSIELVAGEHSAWERARAERLRCWKYLSTAWTHAGLSGVIERACGLSGATR